MANSILLFLTNPVSADREDEFNNWYSNVHGKEVAALPGFKSVTRYRTTVQVMPPSEAPAYRYLALYEVEDADAALAALAEARPRLNMSDSADFAGASGFMFEVIAASD